MKQTIKFGMVLLLMLFTLIQTVFGDVIIDKSPLKYGNANILLVFSAILATWAISFVIIKRIRDKNVGK